MSVRNDDHGAVRQDENVCERILPDAIHCGLDGVFSLGDGQITLEKHSRRYRFQGARRRILDRIGQLLPLSVATSPASQAPYTEVGWQPPGDVPGNHAARDFEAKAVVEGWEEVDGHDTHADWWWRPWG